MEETSVGNVAPSYVPVPSSIPDTRTTRATVGDDHTLEALVQVWEGQIMFLVYHHYNAVATKPRTIGHFVSSQALPDLVNPKGKMDFQLTTLLGSYEPLLHVYCRQLTEQVLNLLQQQNLLDSSPPPMIVLGMSLVPQRDDRHIFASTIRILIDLLRSALA
jgi:hypothetical protein